jgi:hypothetical protein
MVGASWIRQGSRYGRDHGSEPGSRLGPCQVGGRVVGCEWTVETGTGWSMGTGLAWFVGVWRRDVSRTDPSM